MAVLSQLVAFASKFIQISPRHLVTLCNKIIKRDLNTNFVYHNNRLNTEKILLKPFKSSYIPVSSRYGKCKSDKCGVLSPDAITKIISENENYVDINEKTITFMETNQLSANIPMEDMHAEGKLLTNGGFIFGVFDGHNGHHCSSFVSECLFTYIAICTEKHESFNRFVSELHVDTEKPFYEGFVEWFSSQPKNILHDSNKFVTENLQRLTTGRSITDNLDMMERVKTAFVELDKDITNGPLEPLSQSLLTNMMQTAYSGSCATVAFVNKRDLFVANTGDSRAVIGSMDTTENIVAIQLSRDHNSNNNNEMQRIVDDHPGELSTVLVKNRLLGVLKPLRAFGDVQFKWPLDDLTRICPYPILNTTKYHTPPYLTAEPEVVYRQIKKGDKFLVLATDGLWDILSSQGVVTLVEQHMNMYKGASRDVANIKTNNHDEENCTTICDRNCATFLIRHALGVYDEPVSMRLSAPADVARRYRDDITLTIVYFDGNQ